MAHKIKVSNNLVQSFIAQLRRDTLLRVSWEGGNLPTIGALPGSLASCLYDGDQPFLGSPISLVHSSDTSWSNALTYRTVRLILSVWVGCSEENISFTVNGEEVAEEHLDDQVSFTFFRPRPSFVALYMRPTSFRTLTTQGHDQVWVLGTPPYMPNVVLSSIDRDAGLVGLEYASLRQSDFDKVARMNITECARVYSHWILPAKDTQRSYTQIVNDHKDNWLYSSNCVHTYPLEAAAGTPGFSKLQQRINDRHDKGYQNVSSRSIGYEMWYMVRHAKPSLSACSIMTPVMSSDCLNSYIYGSGNRLFEVILGMIGFSSFALLEARNHVTSKTIRKYLKVNADYAEGWGLLFDRIFAINGGFTRDIEAIVHQMAEVPDASQLTQADVFAVANTCGVKTECRLHSTFFTTSTWSLANRPHASHFPWQTHFDVRSVPLGVARKGRKILTITNREPSRSGIVTARQGGTVQVGNDTPLLGTLPVRPVSVDSRLVMTSGLLLRLDSSCLPESRVFEARGFIGMDTLGPWATGDTYTGNLPSISERTFINRRVVTPASFGRVNPPLTDLRKLSFSWE